MLLTSLVSVTKGSPLDMPNRLKLLVAEDSQMDAFILQRTFEQTGVAINAHFVRDGQEATDYLEGVGEFGDRAKYPLPALILLDLKMPRLNGFDVLKWLKLQPEHRTTPVIIFSGSDDHGDILRAYSLGASSYMVKPTHTAEMPDLVRVLDAYWRRFGRVPVSGN